jgi:hypothetical protein
MTVNVFGVGPNFAKVLSINNPPMLKTYASVPHDAYSFLYTPAGYMTSVLG